MLLARTAMKAFPGLILPAVFLVILMGCETLNGDRSKGGSSATLLVVPRVLAAVISSIGLEPLFFPAFG